MDAGTLLGDVPEIDDDDEIDVDDWITAATGAIASGEKMMEYLRRQRYELQHAAGDEQGLPDGASALVAQLDKWAGDDYWGNFLTGRYAPEMLLHSVVDIPDLYAEFGTYMALCMVALEGEDWGSAGRYGQAALTRMAGWHDFTRGKEPARLVERVACGDLLRQAAARLWKAAEALPTYRGLAEYFVGEALNAYRAVRTLHLETGAGVGEASDSPARKRLQEVYGQMQEDMDAHFKHHFPDLGDTRNGVLSAI